MVKRWRGHSICRGAHDDHPDGPVCVFNSAPSTASGLIDLLSDKQHGVNAALCYLFHLTRC